MHATEPRRKLIVIHGYGATFADAAVALREVSRFECGWSAGSYLVDRRVGILLRRLLSDSGEFPALLALKKLIVSRFVESSVHPSIDARSEGHSWARFSERFLEEEFPEFEIPFLPGERLRRAAKLKEEAQTELRAFFEALDKIIAALRTAEGGSLLEEEARAVIRSNAAGQDGIPELLEAVRDMHESGGDTDTVASASFYAHWLTSEAAAAGAPLVHGRDWRFVFINYHDCLAPLGDYGPAEIFMADLPLGAFPDFERDARALAARGCVIKRFEDHHPFTPAHRAMMDRLVADGCVQFYALSGPETGQELAVADLMCGADMVHANTVSGRPWDSPGARRLREATHAEDFVTNRGELGRVLTDLIKGGVCKAELAQMMVASMRGDDLVERVRQRGWDNVAASWNESYKRNEETLRSHAHMLEIKRPEIGTVEGGGLAMGPGSDVPMPATPGTGDKSSDTVRILVALSVRGQPGEPRIPTSRAVEFYARAFPEADYLFYCFGSSILVSRRLNSADVSINLGALMGQLGSAADGGHAGAAVCRPESNPAYPARLLGRVNQYTFREFARYLQFRLQEAGYQPLRIRDFSRPPDENLRQGGRSLAYVMAIALLAGLLLILIFPSFRPAAVRQSNEKFFPQIGVADLQNDDAPSNPREAGE